MACVLLFFFLSLSRLVLLRASKNGSTNQNLPHHFPPGFPCGKKLGEIQFPFTTENRHECGLCLIQGCNTTSQKIQLERYGPLYELQGITRGLDIKIKDVTLEGFLNHHDYQPCESLNSAVFFDSSSLSLNLINPMINILKCEHGVRVEVDFNYIGCSDHVIYCNGNNRSLPDPPPPLRCWPIQLPATKEIQNFSDIFSVLSATFDLELEVSLPCYDCYHRGGEYLTNRKGEFECSIGR